MGLNPADIATVSGLLDEALALPAEERESWLAGLPVEHKRLAPVLRGILDQAALTHNPYLAALPAKASNEAIACGGDLVGPYRLMHEIGRGGMGSVWLAERADGNFNRKVALKLPRLIWGGGLAERMARERDIGARLEHPNIARLYDAGVDERGRPYLAFEFIDGPPIDVWCRAGVLDVPDRMRLFLQVVHAVAYAHGQHVVHRDLKPSNVLVSADGQVHLLDFGIAKLMDEDLAGKAGLTQQHGSVMTPLYASPEQISGESVKEQSDVYSLGVLLYELLTGELPLAPKHESQGAVRDAILNGVGRAASSRVRDRRQAKAIRGEVDAILSTAMHRELARRYRTAHDLAQDIQRHLNGEAIAARPDSAAYRLRRVVRRHVGSVILVSFAFLILALVNASRIVAFARDGSAMVQVGQAGTLIPLDPDLKQRLLGTSQGLALAVQRDSQTYGQRRLTVWSISQAMLSLAADERMAPSAYARYVREVAGPNCACWTEPGVNTARPAIFLSGWVLVAMAQQGIMATPAEVNYLLEQQRADGSWAMFEVPGGSDFASPYATAWALMGLNAQRIRQLLPPARQEAVDSAIANGRAWLLSVRERDAARWKRYPNLSYSDISVSVSGTVLHALHVIGTKGLEGIDRLWLDNLPERVAGQSESPHFEMDTGSGKVVDAWDQIQLPWALTATADAYASGDLLQRSRASIWFNATLSDPQVPTAETETRDWWRSEILFGLRYVLRRSAGAVPG